MSINRIQKLLFSEYCDFEDMVLVEGPFAETTREGRGIRQVHLGLTPTKLVIATDILVPASECPVKYERGGVDPDTETFELIAVYPVECVNLSIFRRRKRQSLKAHFCNNRIVYFELGGFEKRNMFWNLWCERVKFLCPEDIGSSHTETSVASSTSNSTIYLLASQEIIGENGKKWLCTFGAGDGIHSMFRKKWTEKHIFLGETIKEDCEDELDRNNDSSNDVQTIYKMKRKPRAKCSSIGQTDYTVGTLHHVSRFKSGVEEGCLTGLYLPVEDYVVPSQFSTTTDSTDDFILYPLAPPKTQNYIRELADEALRRWERATSKGSPGLVPSVRNRHRRRYAFAPQPHFHYGLGPWNPTPGDRFSVQLKRVVSAISIRRQPSEYDLRLPISRRQLVTTISQDALDLHQLRGLKSIPKSPTTPVIFFWTPDYWYRPRSAKEAYQELQVHLKKVKCYQQQLYQKSYIPISVSGRRKRKIFRKRKTKEETFGDSDEEEDFGKNVKFGHKDRKSKQAVGPLISFHNRKAKSLTDKQYLKGHFCCMYFGRKGATNAVGTSIDYLKRILHMDVALTTWDFDSTCLAYQITMIDRDLFLKITEIELAILFWQQSSKNTPNVGAVIAFSHRTSCLVTTEILRDECPKVRARLIARFISIAEKCHQISNFQSCRNILCGLQSPPVYRLHSTWTQVRRRHASKYVSFEKMCRLYRDARLPVYQRAFYNAKQNSPYLPYIGDIIAQLLDKVPPMNEKMFLKSFSEIQEQDIQLPDKQFNSIHKQCSYMSQKSSLPNILRRFISAFRIWPSPSKQLSLNHPETDYNGSSVSRKTTTVKLYREHNAIKNIRNYFDPVSFCENRREERLQQMAELLHIFQKAAANYGFTHNEVALDYLLKARYREEKENFFYSFKIETVNQ